MAKTAQFSSYQSSSFSVAVRHRDAGRLVRTVVNNGRGLPWDELINKLPEADQAWVRKTLGNFYDMAQAASG